MSRFLIVLLSSALWAVPSHAQTLLEVDHDRATFGHSVAIAGDVNGDGFDDVLVGAPRYSGALADEGAAYLFLGSAAGIATTPAWSVVGGQAEARLGSSVAAAGDIDNDGFGDVIIGVPQRSNPTFREGAAWVFLGSPAGLSPVPDHIVEGGQPSALLGTSVASAGDVNGDGYGDVIIGSPLYDFAVPNDGSAAVFHGGPSGLAAAPSWSAGGAFGGVGFGTSVASAGDVDGDGYDDVVVGAPDFSNGEALEGRASLFKGGPAGLGAVALTRESNQLGARFGSTVAPAFDVNGDTWDDVLVGARLYSNGETYEGRAYLFFGVGAGGAIPTRIVRESDQAYAYLGIGLSSAGDVNGDGVGDVIIGMPSFDAAEVDEGRAMVFLGGSGALVAVVDGGQAGAELGTSVAGGGDVNGDGYDDVVIGAPKHNSGQADEGVVWVFLGG